MFKVVSELVTEYPVAWRFENQRFDRTYWARDGEVWWREARVPGADSSTFRFYAGNFAKDAKRCYIQNRPLRNADPETFRALNFTYAVDKNAVWTIEGRIKDAIAEDFEACDDGLDSTGSLHIPHSYGKDRVRVFYYDFDGKPGHVRKADPETFVSLNDGFFGRDDKNVFFGLYVLPKVRVRTWEKLGGFYSRDDRYVYYANRMIEVADTNTFRVVPRKYTQLAFDHRRWFHNDREVTEVEFRVWCDESAR